MAKPKSVHIDAVLARWAPDAGELYARMERAMFGIAGLQTAGRLNPRPAILVRWQGKDIAEIAASPGGLEVRATVPKRFREQALDLDELTPSVGDALRAPVKPFVVSLPVRNEPDADAAAAVIRARAAFAAG